MKTEAERWFDKALNDVLAQHGNAAKTSQNAPQSHKSQIVSQDSGTMSMSECRGYLERYLELWGNARWWHGYNTAKSEMLDKEKGE